MNGTDTALTATCMHTYYDADNVGSLSESRT